MLSDIEAEFGVKVISRLEDISKIDCVILMVEHKACREIKLDDIKGLMSGAPILIDIRRIFARKEAEEKEFYYLKL